MRIVFIGRDNAFNRRIIKELLSEHEIACCFFVEPHRDSYYGKYERIKQRLKKYPVFKVVDEFAFHGFDRLILRRKEKVFLKARPEYFSDVPNLQLPIHVVENIHEEKYINMIREMKPDIIFSVCCSVIFKPILYQIPVLGTYVLHEGITPEYRGLHNNLWALMKGDFCNIGYTVLKVDNTIDGGKILVQGRYELAENENYRSWGWINHNAIIMGVESIKKALKKLEIENSFYPVSNKTGNQYYYTWMGLSDFVILYIKNYLPKSIKSYYSVMGSFMRSLVS